jgi:hypothetical protein
LISSHVTPTNEQCGGRLFERRGPASSDDGVQAMTAETAIAAAWLTKRTMSARALLPAKTGEGAWLGVLKNGNTVVFRES